VSEREGNTDAPKVDERDVHADKQEESAPRRMREVRAERGPAYAASVEERGTSWVSVVIGWLAALGAGLILSGIVSGIVGAIFGAAGRQGIQEGGTTALIGLLISLLLAFLIGGYAASRLASRQGLKHGLLVPLLALVVMLVLAIVGGSLGGQLYRPAQRRDATRECAERTAEPGHDPGSLGSPRAALPLPRRGYRWRLGSQDRTPQAVSKERSRQRNTERRVK